MNTEHVEEIDPVWKSVAALCDEVNSKIDAGDVTFDVVSVEPSAARGRSTVTIKMNFVEAEEAGLMGIYSGMARFRRAIMTYLIWRKSNGFREADEPEVVRQASD